MTQTSISTYRRGCRDCSPFILPVVPFDPQLGAVLLSTILAVFTVSAWLILL